VYIYNTRAITSRYCTKYRNKGFRSTVPFTRRTKIIVPTVRVVHDTVYDTQFFVHPEPTILYDIIFQACRGPAAENLPLQYTPPIYAIYWPIIIYKQWHIDCICIGKATATRLYAPSLHVLYYYHGYRGLKYLKIENFTLRPPKYCVDWYYMNNMLIFFTQVYYASWYCGRWVFFSD